MKLSTAGLKNLDYKQVAVDHGEKVVFVLIAMVVVWALYGTRWLPYQKSPDELSAMADDAKEEIVNAPWPESEAKQFQPKIQLAEQVDRLLADVNASRYNFSTPYVWPLYRQKEPISEPRYVAVEHLISSPGQVLVPMKLDIASQLAEAGLGAEKKEEKKKEEKKPSSEFGPRKDRPTSGRSSSRPGVGTLPTFGGLGSRADEEAELTRQAEEEWQKRYKRKRSRKRGEDGDTAGGFQISEKGKGYRFVAVRGVYPLHQQLLELRKSLHVDTITTQELMSRVQLNNFELQRQTAIRGAADPWTGPWEPVDMAVAKMVLDEAAEWEDDTLALGVTSGIITSPLPYRAVGDWGDLASHPNLKDFELTDEEIDAQIKISQKLLENMREEKAKEEPKLAPGGFSILQEEIRSPLLTTRGTTEREKELEALIKELGKDVNGDEERKRLEELIRNREKNPAGNLLLFRYLDFDVRQGQTYRYRVRLTLLNPYYGLPPEDVVSPEVAEGQLRNTEWSNPTEPATIPEDADYFVAKVEAEKPGVIPNARVDLFQWSSDSGTIVNAALKTLVGQYISGSVKTHVLRPVPETFELENFAFATDDVLVDVSPRPTIDRSLHSDLNIPQDAKEIPGLTEQALVMNRFGELVTIDPSSRGELKTSIESRFNDQNESWKEIKDKAAEAAKNPVGNKRGKEDEEGGGFARLTKDNPRRKARAAGRGKD